MNDLIRRIRGFIKVEAKGADPVHFLNLLTQERIPFWDLLWIDDTTIQYKIFRCDEKEVSQLAVSSLYELSKEEYPGIKKYPKALLCRPILFLGIIASVAIILYAQRYLLFYEVIGNETVSSTEIMRTIENVGVGFGEYGANIDPKLIKNHVLSVMPQLQWVTITQNGSAAKVVVRERPHIPEITDRKGYANIVASRAGMITELSVYEGQPLKKVGDFVDAGEMIVSGVVDLERIYTVVNAQAEVFAKTWCNKTTVTPVMCLNKTYTSDKYLCIWMEIGKRKIKIFGNSGISTCAYDKIVKRSELTLPGGYTLPVALLVETLLPYSKSECEIISVDALGWLVDYSRGRVMSDMCAGEILKEDTVLSCVDGRYELEAYYECHEMIAQTAEGIFKKEDFEND